MICMEIRALLAASAGARRAYGTWARILDRIVDPRSRLFIRYGGRGIQVCDRWLDFRNFYADMGDRQDGESLDRINNDGNYGPENCRWATSTEQARNQSRNVWIQTPAGAMLATDVSLACGVSKAVVSRRVAKGLSYAEIVAPANYRPGAKLGCDDVVEIRRALNDGVSDAAVAERFGVTKQNIGCIRRGKTWVDKSSSASAAPDLGRADIL